MMVAAVVAVPALVAQAAQRTAQFERGVVGFRLHRVLDVHAGPYHRRDEMELAVVYDNGRLVKVRVLDQKTGGTETSDSVKAQTAEKYEHPAATDVFARPYDVQHFGEYTYSVPQGSTVHFHAIVHDAAHGDGFFSVDSQGDVVSLEYSPAVMPQYAHSGTIDQQMSAVLPDYWALTKEVQHYSGRYFLFSGGATVTIDQSSFVQFPSEAAALSALDAGRI